ncbi:ethanolamine ammonia-lyase subunit EutB [Klebsiella pneumoniae subsp. pneumoniae]|nr:ethanolamine ammonia-lyase subunit EutB [Klebsiella pneumoniae subsp. pneumoniae]
MLAGGSGGEFAAARGRQAGALRDMTVADIRNNPVIPYEEDCVTRLIQDDVNENRLSAD